MRAFLAALVTGGDARDLNVLQAIAPDDNSGRYYRPFVGKSLDKATLAEIARARPQAQRAMAAKAEGFLFLKTHNMLAHHLGTPTIATDVTAGAIYLLRNPLDVAVSYSAFRDQPIDDVIAKMRKSQRVLSRPKFGAYDVAGSWSENVHSWTRQPHPRLLVLRYEDMVASPIECFGKVVEFLRMDVDDLALARAVERSSFEKLRAAEAESGFQERPPQTRAFFRSGRAGEWRERLSDRQVANIVLPHAAQMQRFGYWLPEFDRFLEQEVQPAAEQEASSRP